jgi:glycosyltransferase involved in cell wall biosynthesis
MKILWLVPLILGERLQVTSRNELARSLRDRGHEISTVVGLRDKRLRVDGFSSVRYVRMTPGSVIKTIKFHLVMLFSLWYTEAEIILFGISSAHLLPFSFLLNFFRKNRILVLDIRTVPVDIPSGWNRKFQMWRYHLALKLANRFCDGVTVITPMLLNTVEPYLKKISKNIGVWTSGVCFDYFKSEGPSMRRILGLQDKKVLFYHGVLSPNRGIQNAIRAVALLRKQIPNLVFLLVGDGEGLHEFMNLAKELDISDRIIITGRVAYKKIAKFVRVADIGILPFPAMRCWEVSSPIKLMEYLAMKVPVIATDIQAHRTVLAMTGGGLLIPNNEPKIIAYCIRQILNCGQKIFKEIPLQKNLEDIISWNAQAKRLETFLENLIKNAKK